MSDIEYAEHMRQLIEQFDDYRLLDHSPHERVEMYAGILPVPKELAVLVRSLQHDAVLAMHDLGVPRKVLLPISHGAALLGSRNVGKYEWNGYALVDALAVDAVDTSTGVITRAVPVDRLRAVLPACANERTTSSRWNARAVEEYVPLDRYRKGEPVYEDTVEIVPTMAMDERDA
jgi:hypothetical protein